MDTIYSNKKYLQNLNAADYYRTNTMRPANEYASYHNTMSRRSLFGSHYSHQQQQQQQQHQQQPNISKYKYSYPSDVSLSSHYGYTSWGLWRETGHLSPSVYSKKRINIRSFSILIMSAAFIVLLAVLAVAALAFYFSTFKSDPSDSMLVFDCAFRIGKGDIWTSQLKYNHTPAFRQKAAFYTKFIETSLEHGSFNVAKTDINDFGPGPELLLSFRIYLDMRKIQMTITNVEEHIKNALISETASSDSAYRNMKIDIDSIEIKRQLDPDVLQKAAFIHEQDILTTLMPTTVIPLDDLPKKPTAATTRFKSSTAASTLKNGRTRTPPKPIHESDIDMDNLPVIQGSFEITKTDADIAQKRSSAAAAASRPAPTPTTLKPFHISPASSIKVKQTSGQQQPASTSMPAAPPTQTKSDNIVEMFLQHQKNLQQQQKGIKEPPVTAKIEKTNKSGEPTTTTTTERSSSSSSVTPSVATKPASTTIAPRVNADLPKLDVGLFTSAPVLDNEPWRPINPSPEQQQMKTVSPASTTESGAGGGATEMPAHRSPFHPPESVVSRNKFVDPDQAYPANDSSDESVFYQSFYNPDFSAGSLEIEKLGTADVRPYPLPVNKIDVSEEAQLAGANQKLVIDTANYDENRFEHLGGGVIAKKHDNSTAIVSENATETSVRDDEAENATATSFDDIFQELLDHNEMFNKTEDVLESRIAPDTDSEEDGEDEDEEEILTTTPKLNFMNMKDFIMQMQHNKSESAEVLDDAVSTTTTTIATTTLGPTTTFVEVDTVKSTPPPAVTSTLAEPQLFPSISKWEFVNGTRANISEASVTKKVFNETLQAVIVENVQERHTQPAERNATQHMEHLRANQTLDKANLQQLSSIFDTLAAKLGIRTDVNSKVPPFSQNIQSKLKQTQVRSSTRKNTSTTVPGKLLTTTTAKTTIKKSPTSTLASLVKTTRLTTTTSTTTEPTRSSAPTSSESVVGEAEVEAVDPTQYEEILSLASSPITRVTSTTPSLVTLLPVKSNVGIRNFNPRLRLASANQQATSGETRNMETVVKASMSFDA